MDDFDLSEKIRYTANEILEKSDCVRCGKSVPGGGPGVRCKSCRDKLNRARQTVGHPERAQNKAQQARRRENHGNGTATPKSKGKSESNAKLAASFQSAEKKAGEKLSPDRKENGKGYASNNTRHIPEKANVGRHNADPKKLKEFRDRLKKTGLTEEELAVLIAAKIDSDSAK
jgi:DNA-directed RNA polymerase subunit RPC12/RpoP